MTGRDCGPELMLRKPSGRMSAPAIEAERSDSHLTLRRPGISSLMIL